MLDRQSGKPGALFPDQLIGLALATHHLAPAPGEHQDVMLCLHQCGAVLRRAQDHSGIDQQLAPAGQREMTTIAQSPQHDAVAGVDMFHHQRDVQQAVKGMVAGPQGRTVEFQGVQALEVWIEIGARHSHPGSQGRGRGGLEFENLCGGLNFTHVTFLTYIFDLIRVSRGPAGSAGSV